LGWFDLDLGEQFAYCHLSGTALGVSNRGTVFCHLANLISGKVGGL
jgi:hypothetical protein